MLKEAFTEYSVKHGLVCLGVFVRPITTDPDEYVRLDITGYKFDEFITSSDDQLIAQAASFLNILAHQVAQEIKLFDQTM